MSGGSVVLVGQLPPPHGGMSVHVEAVQSALTRVGISSRVVDTRARRHSRFRPIGLTSVCANLLAARVGSAIVHVHTNGHNRASWMLAAVAALPARPRKLLLTLHSGLAPAYVRANPRTVRMITIGYHRVIAVSEPIAFALREVGVSRDRVVALPAFVASGMVRRLAPAGLAALRSRHRLLVAAALAPGPEYGAELLLRAIGRLRSRLPGIHLVIYGPGTRTAVLQERARALGLEGHCSLFGELPHAEGLALLEAADLLVRPTLADGDALSVREALALGTTVVATSVVPRPAGVHLSSPDPESLTDAIQSALEGGPRRSSLNPPRTATDGDAWPNLLALYRELGAETRV